MCSGRSTSVNTNTNTNTKANTNANTNINKINIGPYHAVLNTEAKLVLGVWTLDLDFDHWGTGFCNWYSCFCFSTLIFNIYLISSCTDLEDRTLLSTSPPSCSLCSGIQVVVKKRWRNNLNYFFVL